MPLSGSGRGYPDEDALISAYGRIYGRTVSPENGTFEARAATIYDWLGIRDQCASIGR